MMLVACQTPSSDVVGGRYRSHDPSLNCPPVRMDPHQPFSKVFFYEYSFSIISNFLDSNKPVTAEAGVIENVRTKCIIIYCGSSPLLDDSSVSSTTKTRCYQAAVNNGIVMWETPQNDNFLSHFSDKLKVQ